MLKSWVLVLCLLGCLVCDVKAHEKVAQRINIKPGETQSDTISLQDVVCTFTFDIAGGGTSEEWELRLEEDGGYFLCSAGRSTGSYLLFKGWNLSVSGRKISEVEVRDNDGKLEKSSYLLSDKAVQSVGGWKGLLAAVTLMTGNAKIDL